MTKTAQIEQLSAKLRQIRSQSPLVSSERALTQQDRALRGMTGLGGTGKSSASTPPSAAGCDDATR
jgi:putative protein kinase ArgK-like GTPase of G3E family